MISELSLNTGGEYQLYSMSATRIFSFGSTTSRFSADQRYSLFFPPSDKWASQTLLQIRAVLGMHTSDYPNCHAPGAFFRRDMLVSILGVLARSTRLLKRRGGLNLRASSHQLPSFLSEGKAERTLDRKGLVTEMKESSGRSPKSRVLSAEKK
jgi:hypothetical protein